MMPIFTDALLGDTLHLSAEEFGAYCLLLFATWRNNGRALADDDHKMARICRVTPLRWRDRLKPVLRAFFDTSDGTWHQKRLEKEWNYVEHFASEQSRKGRLSALKRWGTGITDPSFRLKPDDNPHTHTQLKKEEDPPLKAPPADKPTRNGDASHDRPNGRGTRLPKAWRPSPDDAQFAADLGLDAASITDQFRDYWIAVSGAKAYKVDWDATWRNWCRRAEPRTSNGHARPGNAGQGDSSIARALARVHLPTHREGMD